MKCIFKYWPLSLVYPLLLVGFLVSLLKPDSEPDIEPIVQILPPIPGTVPTRPIMPVEPIRTASTKPNTIHLGGNLYAIGNQTGSFGDLINQAAQIPGAAIIDRHFNSFMSKGSGHLMLCNEKGYELATALNAEYKKIYDEQGWHYDHPNLIVTSRANSLAVLRIATQRGMAAVIEEFGFIDDRENGDQIGDFIRSVEGQKRIAQATIDATKKVAWIKNIVLSAGHHGNRGTSGASYKGFHETDYAFATFEAIRNILKNPETASVADKQDEYDGYFFSEAKNLIIADQRSPVTGAGIPRLGFIGPSGYSRADTKQSNTKKQQR